MEAERRKSLPDPKESALTASDMDYLYFEAADLFPFVPCELDYSAVNAWWLCEAAFVCYNHPGFARMAFKLAGFDRFCFFGGRTTECMIAWNVRAVIVAFRGTELRSLSTLREIATDLNAVPVDFPEGGRVHRGFSRALEEVWPGPEGCSHAVGELLREDPERPIWFTGHSLGGALASLAFARVPDAAGLYVFGSPRVGDEEFAELASGRPVWRVENARDPIPLVPPDLPSLGLRFTHVGELRYISEEGELRSERPEVDLQQQSEEARRVLTGQIERLRRFFRSLKSTTRIVLSGLDHELNRSIEEWKDYLHALDRSVGIRLQAHMPVFYAIRLWNLLVDREGSGDGVSAEEEG
jgi:hypothetical protein